MNLRHLPLLSNIGMSAVDLRLISPKIHEHEIQILYILKKKYVSTLSIMIQLDDNFAYVLTAMLAGHMQNSHLIGSSLYKKM